MLSPSLSARSTLFDAYGDFALHAGRSGALRLGALVCLGDALGYTAAAIRAGASRMAQDGWLTVDRHGRESIYSLTTRGRQLVDSGQARIFAEPDPAWDGTWYLVGLSVPETHREVRDRMRKALSWLGFGSPSSALYLSPRDHRAEVIRLADELGAGGYLQMYSSMALYPDDPHVLVSRAWPNLHSFNQRYAEFVCSFTPQLASARARLAHGSLADDDAFRLRMALVSQFRRCLFEDPELPPELLPANWCGFAARRLFLDFHQLVTPAGLRYFDAVCSAGATRNSPDAAAGRVALSQSVLVDQDAAQDLP